MRILWSRIMQYFRREKELRGARKRLDVIFRERTLLKGTSLRPEHRGRTQVLEVLDGGNVVRFGIIRHPRPYAFSKQYHEVFEMWEFRQSDAALVRMKGFNLSRLSRDSDGRSPDHGPGF